METQAGLRQDILYDPRRQEEFYRSSKAWIETLAERNGLVGELTVMPNDPDRYPYQRLDAGFIEAFQPNDADPAARAEIQNNMLAVLRHSACKIIGEENYDNFSQDLLIQTTAPGPSLTGSGAERPPGQTGSALRTLLARLDIKDSHSALVGYHPNILALPIYAAGLLDAARAQRESEAKKPFDMFKLTSKMIMPINKSLAFAEFRGGPAVEQLGLLSALSLKVPATASSRLFGIDSELRKTVNQRAEEQFEAHLEKLTAEGSSALLVTDPTGSTAERINDEHGRLSGLRFRRITPSAYDMLDRFSFAWPVTMWWQDNPHDAKWYVGHPHALGISGRSQKLVEDLALQTGRLAGAEVYFGKNQNPLGRTAVGSAVNSAGSLTA